MTSGAKADYTCVLDCIALVAEARTQLLLTIEHFRPRGVPLHYTDAAIRALDAALVSVYASHTPALCR